MPPSTVSILTSKSATRCRVVPAFPRIFLCICAGALFYERAWSRNARGAGKPQHKQAPRREKSLRRFWSRRRDYLRLYGQVESRGFYERLDGFATAGVRSREPTAENKASHFQTFRRLWFKPLATVKTPRRQKCRLGVLVEATGFAPLAARPGEQPTGLFSLRPSDMFPSNSRANRSRLHPQIPSMFVKTGKRADESQLSFPCL